MLAEVCRRLVGRSRAPHPQPSVMPSANFFIGGSRLLVTMLGSNIRRVPVFSSNTPLLEDKTRLRDATASCRRFALLTCSEASRGRARLADLAEAGPARRSDYGVEPRMVSGTVMTSLPIRDRAKCPRRSTYLRNLFLERSGKPTCGQDQPCAVRHSPRTRRVACCLFHTQELFPPWFVPMVDRIHTR